jgi:hypothetical protein
MSFIYISNINQSAISFGGNLTVNYGTDPGVSSELLLKALEIEHEL